MSNFFEYKNIQVHFKSKGKGPAIILLHGFLENISMWNEITATLSIRNRVITIDLLGHGKTENLGYIHTMEEQAHLVRSLLINLNLRKVTLIGHSMGGYVALAFADLFPKNTKGFCLLNATSYPDSKAKKVSRDRAITAVKQHYKTFVRISIPMLFSEENRTLLKDQINSVTEEALKTSKQGIIASLEGMKIREDRSFLLKDKSFKKLLVLGENDTVLDFDTHKKQVINTNTELKSLPQGHMSHIETTDTVVSILKKF
jgi:pimeloyl-ACP methyl ester carboxylesterase